MQRFRIQHQQFDSPSFAPSNVLVTTVVITPQGGHAMLSIFARGQNTGSIIVNLDDAEAIAQRLIPSGVKVVLP